LKEYFILECRDETRGYAVVEETMDRAGIVERPTALAAEGVG
jgi:hypothetical protein